MAGTTLTLTKSNGGKTIINPGNIAVQENKENNDNNEYKNNTIYVPNNTQTIDDDLGNDLLLITSKNLPDQEYKGTDLELVYNKSNGIEWKEKKEIKNKNAELINNDTLLSFLTLSNSNQNHIYLIQGKNDTDKYTVFYKNHNKSLMINKTNTNVGGVNGGDIGALESITILVSNDNNTNLTQCSKMNKYYYNIDRSLINKNLRIVIKEENDKEYELIGGTGRKAKIIISNDLDNYDEKIHIRLNENIYIKGISYGGYLYKENDILKVNDILFGNYNFKVLNINKKGLNRNFNEKNIYTTLDKNFSNKNFQNFSSFNISLNIVKYSNKSTEKRTEINFIPKISDSKADIITDANLLFYDTIDNNSDNKGYLILKKLHITALITDNSFYSIKILSHKIPDSKEFNLNEKIVEDESTIEKEVFYNNTGNNVININETFDLNIGLPRKKDTNNNLIYALITSIRAPSTE